MNITLANYPSMAPKVNWSKYPSVQKEVYDQNKAGSLDFEYWKEFLEDEEIKEIVAKHIAVLNTAKGSAKGKAVIAKATKAKAAKASRTTATKKVAAKRATSKPKIELSKIDKTKYYINPISKYVYEITGENSGILTLKDVETGKILREKSTEVQSWKVYKEPKGSAKGKAVIAKATKAKTAKASRTTATKKVAAKRAASKPKINKNEMEYKAGNYLRKNGRPQDIVKIVKVYPEYNNYDAIFWIDGKKTEDILYGNIAHNEYRKTQPEAAMRIIKMQTKVKAEPKPKSAPKPKAMAKPKAVPKPKVVKAKAPAKPKATQADKDKATLTKLKAELTTVKAQVVSNAKFKAKVGDELTKYLKANGLDKQVGLSGTPDEIKKVRTQLKFYKGLLEGDTSDFKTIGKRVGIIYQVKPVKRK